jgi:tetratricopeptide (TPR) repeat protein
MNVNCLWRSLLILIIPLSLQGQNGIDSLKAELEKATVDTAKVRTLILLWETTAYTTPKEAKAYAMEALRISRKIGFKRGEAEALQRIAGGFSVRNLNDSAHLYYNEALSLYKSLEDVKMEGVMLHNIAILHYNEGAYVKALKKTQESLRKASAVNDEHGVASSLQLLGNINHYLGNYDEAQKYLIQCLKIFENLGDDVRYTDGLVYLATNYQSQNKYGKALESLKEAISRYREMEDYIFMMQALNNTGYVYLQQNQLDSALSYLNQTIELTHEYENNSILLLALNNMGKVFESKNEYEKARSYYEESLQLARQLKDRLRIAMVYRNLADLLIRQEQYELAMALYDSALVIGKEVGSKNNVKLTYQSVANAWEKKGNYQRALEYYQKYSILKDSIFTEDKTRKMEEMDARYEQEKKDREIALQKSKIALLSKDLELQTIKQYALIAGLAMVFILAFLIIVNLRQKMNRNRKIREQEKLLEAEKLKNAELQRDSYEKDLAFKKQELTGHALQIVQKNELLSNLKRNISEMEENAVQESRSDYRKLRTMINGSAQTEKEWENFNRHFEQVHHDFLTKLKNDHPTLTNNDLRLSAMLKLNLNTREVATILNISPESVKKARYRLRKKLSLPEEADLHSFMLKI